MKQSFVLGLLLTASSLAGEPATLRLVQTIPLPNVEGRIDHLAVDVQGQRLFVAALGNNSVEVVDLREGKRLRTLGRFHEPQGLAWIRERGQLFVAAGGDDTCHVLDGPSFTAAAVGGPIDDADNVRYDAVARRLYVGCGQGALRVFNARNWTVVGEIALPAHPESFQLETRGPRIFINAPGTHSVEVVNREQKRVVTSWPLKSVQANFPLALDEVHRRLFIGCRKPASLLVLDTNSGKEVANLRIDDDADDVFYDAKRSRLYVSCGGGFLDAIDSSAFTLLERIPTADGARTSLFVPDLNRLYLAVPHRGNQQAEIRQYEPAGD